MPSKKVRAKTRAKTKQPRIGEEHTTEQRGDTAYIHVGSYFPQFGEYIVMTPFENLEKSIELCKEDIGKSQIKSFEKDGTSYIGIIDGKSVAKGSMESMKKNITKYTPFMINHLRDTNDERYITWNTDIALYVAFNSVINQERIVLLDPSVVSSQLN